MPEDASGQEQEHPLPAQSRGRSALVTYGSYLGVSLLGLGNVLLVARVLGPTGRGNVTFLMAVVGITGYVCNLSVHEANANFAGRGSRVRAVLGSNSVLAAIALSVVGAAVAVLALAYVPFLSTSVDDRDLAIALLSMPCITLQTYMVYLARGAYHFTIANVALLVAPGIALAANGVMAAAGNLNVTGALSAWTVGNAISAAILLVHHRDRTGFARPESRLARESLTFGAQSHIGGVLATGSYRIDQWIVGAVAGARELGYYSVAVAWFEGLFLLPMAISAVARPDLVKASRTEAAGQAARLFRVTLIATCVLAAALVLLAPVLCVGIFGEAFRGSIEPLRLLAIGALGVSAAKLLGIALIAQRRPLLESGSMAVGFVAAMVLYVILIPPFGASGAAIASAIAYGAAGLTAAVFVVRALGIRPLDLLPRPSDVRWTARLLTTRAATLGGR